MNAILFFLRLLTKRYTWISLSSLLALITLIAGIGLLSLSGWFISASAFASLSFATAAAFNYFTPAVGVRFFSLLRIMGRYAERLISHETTFRILADIRTSLYRSLEPLAPAHLLKFESSDLFTRFSQDVESLDNLYLRLVSPFFVFITLLALGYIVLNSINASLANTVLIAYFTSGIILPIFALIITYKLNYKTSIKENLFKKNWLDYLQNRSHAIINGYAEEYRLDADKAISEVNHLKNKAHSIYAINNSLILLISSLTTLVITWICTQLVDNHLLSGNMIAVFALGTLAGFEVVTPLVAAYQQIGKTFYACTRLKEIITQKATVCFTTTDLHALANYDISFNHVSFGYSNQSIIHHFSETIKSGEHIAITGSSGCGKSTLVQLLARFWDPDSGYITVGGINLTQFSETQLRELISMATQHSHIFNMSIRENLRLAKPDASDEELWQALKWVALADTISNYPEGLNTWMGEQGRYLSGGQLRRLAIARTLLQSAPIIILDEPTEGLDRITAQYLLNQVHCHFSHKTVVLITHNPLDLHQVDRVIQLQ